MNNNVIGISQAEKFRKKQFCYVKFGEEKICF